MKDIDQCQLSLVCELFTPAGFTEHFCVLDSTKVFKKKKQAIKLRLLI